MQVLAPGTKGAQFGRVSRSGAVTNLHRLRAAAAAFLLAAANLTCADLFTEPGARGVVVALLGDSTIVLGSSVFVSATATADGGPLADARFQFTSSDSTVIDVQHDVLVAKRLGTARITALLVSSTLPSNAPSDTATLRVIPGAVTLDSASVTLHSLGDTVRLFAVVLDADSLPVIGAPIVWTSSDTNRVSVTAFGRILAKANGSASVIATASGRSDTAVVTVQQVLAHYTFQPVTVFMDALAATTPVVATGRDARGNAMTGVAPTFSSRDATIAAVNALTGAVSSLLNGQTFVLATRGTVVDSVAVTVDQRATLVVIQPDPIPPITSLGGQVQLSVRAFDRNAVEIQGFTPAWFTLDPARVTVSSAGLVTAQSVGTARIIALLDGAADTNTVVLSNSPATVIVTPDTASASSVGDTLVFSAVVLNGAQDSISGFATTWVSPDPAIVNVLSDGRAVTLATGFARIIAQAGTRADTGFAIVTNQVAFVDMTPVARTLTALADVDTPATVITNGRGALLARTTVTWTSDDPAIARVNAQGHVTAVDTGITLIRATSANGFFRDSVQYTIQNLPTSIVLGGRTVDTLTGIGQVLVYPVEVRNRRNALIPNFPVAWRTTNNLVVDTVPHDSATAIGFGTTLLIARAAANVEDTATLVVRNLTRLVVDNSVVVPAGTPRTGTGSRPYARIQDAVNAADALDTVFIRRGTGSYAETVALTKRLTLLGDSGSASTPGSFLGSNRNPGVLPLIAHDTGLAAITAFTTAPQTIRYLAIRHTLDGAAIDADASDLTIEWFYVNPPGSVSSRIGRGISVKNSPSGTTIRNSRIRSVRGFGIRLEAVSGVTVSQDSIIGIDSIVGVAPGSGVYVIGGGNVTISGNLFRQAQGPQVTVVGTTSPVVTQNNFASQSRLVRYDAVQGSPRISFNTFDMRFQTGDDGQGSAQDDRAAIELLNSAPPPRLFMSFNTFTGQNLGPAFGFGPLDAFRIVNSSEWFVEGNTIISARYAVRTLNANGFSQFNQLDTAAAYLRMEGADAIVLISDTLRTMRSGCVETGSSSPVQLVVTNSLFTNCDDGTGRHAIQVSGNAADQISIFRTRIDVRRRGTPAVFFSGSTVLLDSLDAVVTDSSQAASPTPDTTQGALSLSASSTVTLRDSRVAGFGRFAALRVFPSGGTPTLTLQRNAFTRNRAGMSLAAPLNFGTVATNDVYDNRDAGFIHGGGIASLPNGFWWGDARGPRRAADATAVGDSMQGTAVTFSSLATPFFAGTVAAGLRKVRGDNQIRFATLPLPKALTVRVVDANGRAVSGVSVTFTVTGGGGNIGGLSSAAVVTNASGLAEVTYTMGPTNTVNTITVTGTSVSIGSVIFTATTS